MSAQHANVSKDDFPADKRAETCLEIAKFWAELRERRRQFEWKVTLGLWAVILSGIAYHEKLMVPRYGNWASIAWGIISLAVFFGYWRLWLYPLWKRNKTDMAQAFHALNNAEQILSGRNDLLTFVDYKTFVFSFRKRRNRTQQEPEEEEPSSFVEDWATTFEAAATLILLVVFVLIISESYPR